MHFPSEQPASALAPNLAAPQHRPRPLPLFLEMLRSETAANPDRMRAALSGLRKYQEAPREPAPEPMPVLAERRGAVVRDYGGDGPPILFVPSLINPPNVLDLGPGNSLLRWLAEQGHRPLLLDWGWPDRSRQTLGIAGHVEDIALPLIERLAEPPVLVGYCLGGTMGVAAAQLAPVRGLATIAAPWRFSGFPQPARNMLANLWRDARPAAARFGALPMEALQSAFWSLDPARTISKFERFAALEGQAARSFVQLEDWANDGPPLAAEAARELFEDFFERDLPGRGEWQVAGSSINPSALSCPALHIASTSDRIVPEASAIPAGERMALALGHVGMVVGSRGPESLWQPLSNWLRRIPATR